MATVIVLVDSRGGNTRAVAEAIAEGAHLVPGVEASIMQARQMDLEALGAAEALAIGSPNYYNYPSGHIKTFFDRAFRKPPFKGKAFAAFSTHGGGGGISQVIEELGSALGLRKIADGIDLLGAPGGDQVKACRHLGQALGRAAANAED